jgi:hypothetical protein
MLMHPAVVGVDEGLERDGDASDEVELDKAKRCNTPYV